MTSVTASRSSSPEALHRHTRALVARALVKLHEDNDLDEPGQWSWQRLDSMPLWCLLDNPQRQQFQRLCGLLVRAPSIARWLDGRSIKNLHSLLGEALVEQVLDEAVDMIDSADLSEGVLSPAMSQPPEAIDAFLLAAGGSVLRSSLDPSLPVARLGDTLEAEGLDIPLLVARAILHKAHALQAEHASSVRPELQTRSQLDTSTDEEADTLSEGEAQHQ